MRRKGEYLISLSNPRSRFLDPTPGDVMLPEPEGGIWAGTDKEYVLSHYASGEDANEVLLELNAYREDIIKGSLEDREVEVSLAAAEIVSITDINPDGTVTSG